ncbi:MAG: M23 family metallopeptidase [Flavobacteriales bacterium TMED288]|nr:peptidase M23 [Flavobacteriales bacterium]RPG53501.1 MAG: M23 family metallopeptidase [Flavobacteriales bacterium TMED288]
MTMVKYYFDKKSLSYKKIRITKKKIFLRISQLFFLVCFIFFILYNLVFRFFESPQEKKLKREIHNLLIQYQIIDKKLNSANEILKDLEIRDDNIYRVIFEAEPINKSIRDGGFGGVNRYKKYSGFEYSNIIKDLNKKIDKLSKAIYVQSKSYDEIIKLAKEKEKMLSHIPAIQPVSNKNLNRMASGYGYRIHPIYKTRKMHWGMDFSAPMGTPVYATGDGKVEKVQWSRRGYGNQVKINHGYGYKTFYAHLKKFIVKKNQNVKRGDLIAYIGNSGTSTAPHLHYEIIKNNRRVNPVNFYFNDLSEREYDEMLKLSTLRNQSFD